MAFFRCIILILFPSHKIGVWATRGLFRMEEMLAKAILPLMAKDTLSLGLYEEMRAKASSTSSYAFALPEPLQAKTSVAKKKNTFLQFGAEEAIRDLMNPKGFFWQLRAHTLAYNILGNKITTAHGFPTQYHNPEMLYRMLGLPGEHLKHLDNIFRWSFVFTLMTGIYRIRETILLWRSVRGTKATKSETKKATASQKA